MTRRHLLAACAAAFAFAAPALGHETHAGDITVVHAFATPSLAGVSNGAAYIESLQNHGRVADKLLRASTPVASEVQLHTMAVDAQGVMRMRELDGIALAPHASVKMAPGMGMHLMLIGLKAPLKAGASFPLTLVFERAGTVQVKVLVQAPAGAPATSSMHMH